MYGRRLERNGIERGLEKSKRSMEDLAKLQENYVNDKEYYEEMFQHISSIEGLDTDVKKEILLNLRNSILEFQVSYNEEIEEKMQEQREIIEDLLIEAGEKLKKYDEVGKTVNAYEKFTSLGKNELKTGTDSVKEKAEKERAELQKLDNDYSKDLELRIQQNEMIRRQIMRDTFSGKN